MGIYEKLKNIPTKNLENFIKLVSEYKNFGLFDYYKDNNINKIKEKYNLNINNNEDIKILLNKVKDKQQDFIKTSDELIKRLNIIDFDRYTNLYLNTKDYKFTNDVDLYKLGKSMNELFIVKRIINKKELYYNTKNETRKKDLMFQIFELEQTLLNIINEYIKFIYNLYKDKIGINKNINYESLYIFYLSLLDEIELIKKEYDNDINYINNNINMINDLNNRFYDKLININTYLYSLVFNKEIDLNNLISLVLDIISKREIYDIKLYRR